MRNKGMGRRDFLVSLASMVGVIGVKSSLGLNHLWAGVGGNNRQERDFSVAGSAPLCARAAKKGLLYGSACMQRVLSSDKEFAVQFGKECGVLVPETELKWATLRPNLNSFNFAPADWLAKVAQENNMLFRGHTLVWHDALPAWFEGTVNKNNAEKILSGHITTVVGHYAGQIHSWDVVNEAINPRDRQPDGMRNTPWLKLLGPEYIGIAFRSAADADSKALLVYNDYRLDYDTREDDNKRNAVLRLLERLKTNGTPIHALGIQAHLDADGNHFNGAKIKDFLKKVASLDLKILVTEMDVADQKLPSEISVRDRIIAGVYEDYLSVVLEEPAVIGVLTWGLSDRYTWLSKFKPREDKLPVRPLLLDEKFKRKLTWNAMARAFDNAPSR